MLEGFSVVVPRDVPEVAVDGRIVLNDDSTVACDVPAVAVNVEEVEVVRTEVAFSSLVNVFTVLAGSIVVDECDVMVDSVVNGAIVVAASEVEEVVEV